MEDLILLSPQVREQKRNEFLSGKNPDGSKIGVYRDLFYAEGKHYQNPLAGFGSVDLILTGRFVEQLYPYQAQANRYLFANRLDYGQDLINKYGSDILGLNQKEFERIEKLYIAPQLIKFIKTKLGQ